MNREELRGCQPVTCPKCAWSPENVRKANGERPAVLAAPGYVHCPNCGMVRDVVGDEKERKAQAKREQREVSWCFNDEIRMKRNKDAPSASNAVGERKPMPSSRSLRIEQGHVGFPEPLPVQSEPIAPKSQNVTIGITREMEAWIQEMAAEYRCSQSDVIRAALAWSIRYNPPLSKKTVKSNWPARRRTTIRIEHDLWSALNREARRLLHKRVGRLASCALDYARRHRGKSAEIMGR